MNNEAAQLYEILHAVQALARSDNALVRVSAERIAAISIDALMELDPGMDNPWDALPWVEASR